MFHPDGVGFRSVFRLLQLFQPDGFVFFLSHHFTPMGLVFVRFGFVTNVSPRWGWFSFGFPFVTIVSPRWGWFFFDSPYHTFSPTKFDALVMVVLP
jgi:hypothetical protein